MSNKRGKMKVEEEEEEEEEQSNNTSKLLFNLPRDVFLDTLSRLPIKSLMVCRCVCKTWRTLLTDPSFANMHITRCSTPQFKQTHNTHFILATHSFNQTERSNLYYIEESFVGNEFVKLWPPFSLTSLAMVDSCNGLICMFQMFSCNPIIYVCNPITEEYIELSPCDLSSAASVNCQLVGFGWSPKTNQYKVLRFLITFEDSCDLALRTEVEVYTLGEESGLWQKTKDAPFTPFLNQNVLLNGALHWMSWGSGGKSGEIYSFDIGDEEFRMIPFPTRFIPRGERHLVRIDVLDGCLALVDHSLPGQIEIWVMARYGVKESWEKRFVVPMQRLQGMSPVKSVKLVCTLKSGEILIEDSGNRLIRYDPRKRCVELFEYLRPQKPFTAFVHVPSLVSPKRLSRGD